MNHSYYKNKSLLLVWIKCKAAARSAVKRIYNTLSEHRSRQHSSLPKILAAQLALLDGRPV